MSDDQLAVGRFMALVAVEQEKDALLTPIQAAILVASDLDIASDSRSFSRLFGIEHALVLRELTGLEGRGDRVKIVRRDARTLRAHFAAAKSIIL